MLLLCVPDSDCFVVSPFVLQDCPICLDTVTNPQALKCKHVFCSGCLKAALAVNNMCPVCKEPQGALRGDQPRGEMTSHCDSFRSLPGYEGNVNSIRCCEQQATYNSLSHRNKNDQCTKEAKICAGAKCRKMT